MTGTKNGVIDLYRIYDGAPDVLRADKSAAGTMPAAAFRHCEAMRTASAFGWYVFPPKDISLCFDGRESYYYENDQWYPVKSANFEQGFRETWNSHAPDNLTDLDPPFLTELFVPGLVQIWSGYFVSSAPGWSLLIRPPANYDVRTLFSAFEGIVETDRFKPCPLFINLRLLKTDIEIFIAKDKPLFQIQPIKRVCYSENTLRLHEIREIDHSELDWTGVSSTLRSTSGDQNHTPGSYGAASRRRAKRELQMR